MCYVRESVAISLCYIVKQTQLSFSIVFQSNCATDVFEFECCALVFYSSFSAHNTSSTDLSRDQNTICV